MVIEKLLPKKEKYEFPRFSYEDGIRYRYYTDYTGVFYSSCEYWYDGRLFLIGKFLEDGFIMLVEAETGVMAVSQGDFCRKPSIKMIIEKFKEKLRNSGKTIHEVIRDFKSRNLDLEVWFINLLTI